MLVRNCGICLYIVYPVGIALPVNIASQGAMKGVDVRSDVCA